jgi:hypothetical protein
VPALYECYAGEPNWTFRLRDRSIRLPAHEVGHSAKLELSDAFYALAITQETTTRIFVGAHAAAEPHLELVLHGASHSTLRFYSDLLLVADSAGRIIGIDPLTGAPVHDLRT